MKKLFISFSILLPCLAMAQNVGIGTTTPADLLDVNGNARVINLHVPNSGSIDLGYGIPAKEVNAGRIGYALFTPNAVDIIGGGTGSNNRRIRFWAEGLSIFTGGASFNGNIAVGLAGNANAKLEIHGRGGYAHNLALIDSSTFNAGSMLFANVARPSSGLMIRGSSFASSPVQNSINFTSADGNTLLLTVRGDGKVGVMQGLPAYTFDVGGDINFSGALYAGGNAGTAGKVLQSNGAATPGWVSPTASLYRNMYFDTLTNDINVPANSGANVFTRFLTLTDSAMVTVEAQAYLFMITNSPGQAELVISVGSSAKYTCASRRSLSDGNSTLNTKCSFKLPAGSHVITAVINTPSSNIAGTVYKYFSRDLTNTNLATTMHTEVVYR
jgi:hypothetical protein